MVEEKINVNFEVSSSIRGVPTSVFLRDIAQIAHEKLEESSIEMRGMNEDVDKLAEKYPEAANEFKHIVLCLMENIESLEGGYCSILDRLGD